MKPLTLEETRLKEEMKARCLAKGQYIDEKAKDKFDMLCHLEDFEVQYWELQQENKKLNGAIQTYDILLKSNVEENRQLQERIEYLERSNNRREDTILEQRQEISNLEDNLNKPKENEKNKMILDKDMFDSLFPIGTIYYSYDKEQKFPYGEWEYRGCNSMAYFFKRIK